MINLKKITPRGKKNYKVLLLYKIKQFYQQLPSLLLFIIFLVGISFIIFSFNDLKFKIIIDDEKKVRVEQILEIIKNQNLAEIKTDINNLALVNNLQVKRKWNHINLIITTNKLIYNYGDNSKIIGFINQNGELFTPKFLAKNNKPTIITNINNIKKSFDKLGIYQEIIPSLAIDKFIDKNIEALILKNGTKIILGRIKQEARLKKMAKYLKIFKFRENSIIDLRYKNGFAKTN